MFRDLSRSLLISVNNEGEIKKMTLIDSIVLVFGIIGLILIGFVILEFIGYAISGDYPYSLRLTQRLIKKIKKEPIDVLEK